MFIVYFVLIENKIPKNLTFKVVLTRTMKSWDSQSEATFIDYAQYPLRSRFVTNII